MKTEHLQLGAARFSKYAHQSNDYPQIIFRECGKSCVEIRKISDNSCDK